MIRSGRRRFVAARFWTCRSTRARVVAERIETLAQLAGTSAGGGDRGPAFLLGVTGPTSAPALVMAGR
jgi:EAL domain-containing protein (putative c-di-GMP-specific phosphodiesterase class I)